MTKFPTQDALPWEALSLAHARLEEERRSGTPESQKNALAAFQEARDRLYLVAATIFAGAVGAYGNGSHDHLGTPCAGYVPNAVWEKIGERLGMRWWREAAEDYRDLVWKLEKKLNRLDDLVRQVRELSDRIDTITPGVGHE